MRFVAEYISWCGERFDGFSWINVVDCEATLVVSLSQNLRVPTQHLWYTRTLVFLHKHSKTLLFSVSTHGFRVGAKWWIVKPLLLCPSLKISVCQHNTYGTPALSCSFINIRKRCFSVSALTVLGLVLNKAMN
eukprot:sb/3474864/